MALTKKKKRKQVGNEQEVQNSAKTLLANIRFQSIDNPIKSVLITSTVPNEGKTATASLLAQAAGSAGMRVLIIECDMRRRSMAAELDVHPANGLYSVLSGNAPLGRAVVNTKIPLVQFLDAEPGIPNPADILNSKRMGELVSKLESVYDFIIFDTPPVGTFVDAAILSTLVDGVIIAVRPDTAKRDELVGAYEQLKAANANIIGLCGTFAEGTGSEYYYAYYTKDGKRVRRSKRNKKGSSGSSVTASAQTPLPYNFADNQAASSNTYQQIGLEESKSKSAQHEAASQQKFGAQQASANQTAEASVRQVPAIGKEVLPGRGSRK